MTGRRGGEKRAGEAADGGGVPGPAARVLAFWFEETPPERWFRADPEFDAEVRRRFLGLYGRAARGALDDWQETPDGALALVIVLDQFPRNLFRDDARAYATDARAREVAARAVDRGFDLALAADRRAFLYMPFQHSESLADQRRSVALFRARCPAPESVDYAERHLRVIERFGRFPHRNRVLGRPATPEEEAFLAGRDEPF